MTSSAGYNQNYVFFKARYLENILWSRNAVNFTPCCLLLQAFFKQFHTIQFIITYPAESLCALLFVYRLYKNREKRGFQPGNGSSGEKKKRASHVYNLFFLRASREWHFLLSLQVIAEKGVNQYVWAFVAYEPCSRFPYRMLAFHRVLNTAIWEYYSVCTALVL